MPVYQPTNGNCVCQVHQLLEPQSAHHFLYCFILLRLLLLQQHQLCCNPQVKPQSPPADDNKKVHYSGPLPSYISPDEQEKLIMQARLHSAAAASVPQAAASKSPPPGFPSVPSINGFAGPSDAKAAQVAPSPDRGRQTSGELLLLSHLLGNQRLQLRDMYVCQPPGISMPLMRLKA